MDTIKQTVTIPQDHKLRMEVTVPPHVPAGEAEVVVVISTSHGRQSKADLTALAGRLSQSRIFARDPIAVQRELRDEWR